MKDKPKNNSSLFFCLVRLCILAALCSCSQGKDPVETPPVKKPEEGKTYYCPMDPEIIQKTPGICPVCNMDLMIKPAGSADTGEQKNKYGLIINPVNSHVLSNVKVIRPETKTMPVKIMASGYVEYDSRRIYDISAKIAGRVEKLYVNRSFQPVRKGQPLLEIFSHELLSAQQDYLYLKNSDSDADMIGTAKKKLLLLGLSEQQIAALRNSDHVHPVSTIYSPYAGYVIPSGDRPVKNNMEMGAPVQAGANGGEIPREGSYLQKGSLIFRIANTGQVWGIFEVFPEEALFLKTGQSVQIRLEDQKDMISARIGFMEPSLKDGAGTIRFKAYLNNQDQKLKIGNLLHAEIDAGQAKGIWVPLSSVLDLGKDKIVFVRRDGAFEPKKIRTGIISGSEAQIIDGLSPEDEIAENAQYMIDSESFVKVYEKQEK